MIAFRQYAFVVETVDIYRGIENWFLIWIDRFYQFKDIDWQDFNAKKIVLNFNKVVLIFTISKLNSNILLCIFCFSCNRHCGSL